MRRAAGAAEAMRRAAEAKKEPVLGHGVWWVLGKALILLAWTAAVILVLEFLVQYVFVWLLGQATVQQTIPTAIVMAVSYGVEFAVLVYLTPEVVMTAKKTTEAVRGKAKKHARSVAVAVKGNEPAPKSQVHLSGQLKLKIGGHRANWAEIGVRGLPTWTDIGLAIIGFLVAMFAAAGATELFSHFPWFDSGQEQNVGFNQYLGSADRIIAFVMLAIVIPIAEELIFRGWLYGRLRRLLSKKMVDWLSMVLSILLTSLLFALLHRQWNVGVVVFVLSVVMCLLRELTGTIYAGILVHILKNTVAFYQLFVLGL